MIDITRIDVGGRRAVRIGTYQVGSNDGQPPELRVFLAAGWESHPSLPLGRQVVDIPASALPDILAALQAIGGTE